MSQQHLEKLHMTQRYHVVHYLEQIPHQHGSLERQHVLKQQKRLPDHPARQPPMASI
jgi:hypothetical protein